jgi:endonuclease I
MTKAQMVADMEASREALAATKAKLAKIIANNEVLMKKLDAFNKKGDTRVADLTQQLKDVRITLNTEKRINTDNIETISKHVVAARKKDKEWFTLRDMITAHNKKSWYRRIAKIKV